MFNILKTARFDPPIDFKKGETIIASIWDGKKWVDHQIRTTTSEAVDTVTLFHVEGELGLSSGYGAVFGAGVRSGMNLDPSR